jgi:mannose-1-phosphate guanylyltransferase
MHTYGHDWALVLAAGDGTRLASLTTGSDGIAVPKQYCSIDGGPSLLELTLRRAERLVPRSRVVTVVAARHLRWWQRDLARHRTENAVVQPANRGTAAGIALPLLEIVERDPRARVVVLPSDHFVADEAVLERAARRALAALAGHPDEIVLLGIEPDAPDGEYGWIVAGDELGAGLHAVVSFVEKPSAAVARCLLARGGMWNSFVFAASAASLLALLERRLPALVAELRAARSAGRLARAYESLPDADFSREILQAEPSALRLLTVPACGWSDLGTPERLATCLAGRRFAPVASPRRRRPNLAERALAWAV